MSLRFDAGVGNVARNLVFAGVTLHVDGSGRSGDEWQDTSSCHAEVHTADQVRDRATLTRAARASRAAMRGVAVLVVLAGCAGPPVNETTGPSAGQSAIGVDNPRAEQVAAALASEGIDEFAGVSPQAMDEIGSTICAAWDREVGQVFVVDVISSEYPTLSQYEAITVSSTVSRAYCPPT